MFDSGKKDGKRKKLADLMPQVRDMHLKIWPQFKIPDTVYFGEDSGNSQKKIQQAWLPTSVMVACAIFFATHTKRTPSYRDMAFKILKTVVEEVCKLQGIELDVMHVDVAGQISWHRCQTDNPFLEACCNKAFMQQNLQSHWVLDLNNSRVPWVGSPSEAPHMADWIAFCLGEVSKKNKKASKRN